MKKTVVVTPSASEEVLKKNYLGEEIIGIDEGILIARKAGARLSLALTSFKTVPLESLLSFLPKERIMKYEDNGLDENRKKIASYLLSHRTSDIIVLTSLDEAFIHKYRLFQLMEEAGGRISLQNDYDILSYYGEGVHVISSYGDKGFTLYGFPEGLVSLEHVSRPLRNARLSFFNGTVYQSRILERIAVLKVQKGGVLLEREVN